MAMPRSAASLIPDHDDSVENANEKDFAPPPPKKLKGEEDNSSIPMSQDPEDEAAREAFDRWCKLFLINGGYPDDSEKKRFKYFKDSLYRKVDNPFLSHFGMNAPQYADRSEEEFIDMTCGLAFYCSISPELLTDLEKFDSEMKTYYGVDKYSWN